ncbi:Probable calcium-binding protein CML48 [Linum perenne]
MLLFWGLRLVQKVSSLFRLVSCLNLIIHLGNKVSNSLPKKQNLMENVPIYLCFLYFIYLAVELESGFLRLLIVAGTVLLFPGPKEFSALWTCLGQWRAIFDRYDRDRSGKIDLFELRDALYGLGYAVPPSVLQILMSKYDDGSGGKIELSFDSFVECGLILKGLTDKFKEKDKRYVGQATFNYDEFMCTVLPFLLSYD